MIFSLDVRRARKGDCLLVHFGTEDDPGLIMIDGGPSSVYGPHLKPRIDEIRDARGLGKNDALPVDLLMISHVDDDHIRGILDLTRELIELQDAHRALPLDVLSFWHNSFDAVIGKKPEEITAAMTERFPTAAASGELPNGATLENDEEWPTERPDEEVILSTLKVLANVKQGFKLRLAAERLNWPFNEKLIIAGLDNPPIPNNHGLTLTIAGPMQEEIEALRKMHDKWLKDLKAAGKSPSAALAAYVDDSVANLSSLVAMAELGGKRMLLTGDARGDKILKGLQLVGLLDPGKDSTISVDLLKVPHHGSARNLETDFFKRIKAEHYVFSGDGKHGNPEREALEMLVAARGDGGDFTIHLTYPVDKIDAERKEDWATERNREKGRKERNPSSKVVVRPAWSDADHSLGALFAAKPKLKIMIVDKETPHLIDLLDSAAAISVP